MGPDHVERVTALLAKRFDLLDALAAGPLGKGELEAELDVSRSTIDRAVRSLESENLLKREGGTVSLTLFGRVLLGGYRGFRAGLVNLVDARPFFDGLGDEASIPFGLFQCADVVTATRRSPHGPIVALQEFLEDANSVQSIVTGVLPEYVRSYHEQVVEHGMDAEIVVRSPILDELLSTYWNPLRDVLATDRFSIYELQSDPPLSLKIAEMEETTEVAVVTYGDQGVSGFVRSRNADAVEWAPDIYERVKAQATPVAPPD
ncbi:MAG: helix-turn-helix transcriptional regulator [Halanaeroarchaeum sp.]